VTTLNLNQLAVAISKIEGKKINLSIAQIKEVLRCFGDVVFDLDDDLMFLEICSKLYSAAKRRAK